MRIVGEKKDGEWRVALQARGARLPEVLEQLSGQAADLRPLEAPLVHLNGTAGAALAAQLEAAARALHEALDALRAAAPNARDYYPLGADRFEVARCQYEARVRAVQAVRADLEALWVAVQDQLSVGDDG